MQVTRSELRTGILVVLTVGILVGVMLYLGAPGVFKPLNTYQVQVDNAAGIKPGASVLLAGRKVGSIVALQSPVPMKNRPKDKPNYEALITVRVDATALVYKECRVRMIAYGLLAELVIDFTNGDETSGLAENGHVFIGERSPDLTELGPRVLDQITPVLADARRTLGELRITAKNIGDITAQGSSFNQALDRFKLFGDNLVQLSAADGKITKSLTDSLDSLNRSAKSVEKFTTQLGDGGDVKVALRNFKSTAVELNGAAGKVNLMLGELTPQLTSIARNADQLTDTLKRQPWRIVWPTTKTYPEETLVASPRPTPEVRRAIPYKHRP